MRVLTICTHDVLDTAVSKKSRHLPDAIMLLLPQLPHLQALCVFGGHQFMIPERHLQAVELLPDLQDLDLNMPSDGTWNESTLEPLQYMTALTSLTLNIYEMRGLLLLSPSLSHLTQLQHLRLETDEGWSDQISQAHLMQTVSKLTGLKSLALEDMVESIPAELERLACLTYLDLNGFDFDDPNFAIPPSFGMCIKLRRVCFSWFSQATDGAWLAFCTCLLLLPQSDDLNVSHPDLSEIHSSSWVLPSRLTTLNLINCRMKTFPAALCCLPQLRDLCEGSQSR